MRIRHALAVLAPFMIAGPAFAQDHPSAYVGSWEVETGSAIGKCSVELKGTAFAGKLSARSIMCLGPLGFLNGWTPSRDGVTLLDLSGREIGSFGPSRGNLVGRLSDGSIVTMRPTSGQRFGGRRNDDRRRSDRDGNDRADCYMREDTGRCADPSDIPPPRERRLVRSIGPLNVRSQEDMSSPVVTQTEAGECFTVHGCRDTKWGPRCEVRWGKNQTGYTIKYFERNGKNYIGFLNRC
ncbi:AprI/Inh family metalloprotease inhibitor [Neorhizobium sp. T25_13]|uniref:AprI/Inh family metalloprotease inhibitor n=1 Tax=Neorhizobium sp. T25_13 TaxID=2093830 RepID=UPI000CF91BA1|nr:AprI/Inh family metalloprotease inhibitor [Neorhizobium sp. T25_13]